MTSKFTHLNDTGAARMVDVGHKPVSVRSATAAAVCEMQQSTADAIRDVTSRKGDVLPVARIAAINAAKRTDELIPLCHSVPMDRVEVQFDWLGDRQLEIRVTSQATAKTGVEMEALVGASIGALTIYDMCKAMDREMTVSRVRVLEKAGGTRGDFSAPASA
ncbi:MAG: cyclic pyranopterin monophosphate synthase MoaC [Pirellulaceae bacterium]